MKEDKLNNEIWLDIIGYEGIYKISNCGRIKRLAFVDTRGNKIEERILKQWLQKRGEKKYYLVQLKGKRLSLATLVAKHYVDKYNGNSKLVFKDKNTLNILPENLAWVSNQEYSRYCNSHSFRVKINNDREYAINNCEDGVLKKYYETEKIEILYNYWIELRKEFVFKNFSELEADCFNYFIDRAKRYSIIGSVRGLIIMYSKEARRKLKKHREYFELPSSIKCNSVFKNSLLQFVSAKETKLGQKVYFPEGKVYWKVIEKRSDSIVLKKRKHDQKRKSSNIKIIPNDYVLVQKKFDDLEKLKH